LQYILASCHADLFLRSWSTFTHPRIPKFR